MWCGGQHLCRVPLADLPRRPSPAMPASPKFISLPTRTLAQPLFTDMRGFMTVYGLSAIRRTDAAPLKDRLLDDKVHLRLSPFSHDLPMR